MRIISVFLLLLFSCSFQESNDRLIIGDWNGTERSIIYEVYKNDSLVFHEEKLTDHSRRMIFKKDSISMGIVKEEPIDTYTYSIDDKNLTIDGSVFEILQLDESLLKIKVIYSEYEHHIETYERSEN